MTQFRNALLISLATLTLAACGGGSSGSNGTAAAASPALVSQNVGLIDRSQGSDQSASASSVTTVASSTAATTTTPAADSGSSSTVAKATTPVKLATSNGVATLDWMPPTANTDGSALTNLAGYTVYYGTSPDNLTQSVKVSNSGLTAYSVTGLTSGTWYFAVTSYAADGTESARTTTVSTQI